MIKSYLVLLWLLTGMPLAVASGDVPIIVSSTASFPEKIAALELAGYLKRLYPDIGFEVDDRIDDTNGVVIRLGTMSSMPDLLKHLGNRKVHGPESYIVTKATIDGRETGLILGSDPAGVMYGVYGLLEQLGCGFFISFDTVPKPLSEEFNFDKWDLANRPLTPERIVFNWHNFLTGCTAWDLKHWKDWIAQSQKSGFNTIMVHAYGNNPMFCFEFNGKTKEVGYIATTRHGRDWGINHINDIRRGYGGFIFNDAVFGSEAAKVPYSRRVKAKQAMMHKVFEFAKDRGMKINFALDVDTEGANPQDVIRTLPEKDRFKIGGFWVVRSDTPGGYQYYKAQAEALFDAYPQINTLTLWRRKGPGLGSIWPLLKISEMPKSWQTEYNAYIATNPKAAKVDLSVFNFAIAKVFRAWRRALDELGKRNIPIATGSWRFEWLEGAIEFVPEDMKLLPLDYECMRKDGGRMGNRRFIEKLGKTIQPGRLVPIIWAHHDDGAYIGAPLPFLKNFNNKLKTCRAAGFGVIHWMAHPLDPYFTSHSRQTWAMTENESSYQTYRFIADRWFGQANGKTMSEYIQKWVEEMPSFGRETTERFINRPIVRYGNVAQIVTGCQERIDILERAQPGAMSVTQERLLASFKAFERFVARLFQTQDRFDRAREALTANDLETARTLLAGCRPDAVIEQYADLIRKRGATRGEEGLVVTMNTRWIPWHVRVRQQAGLEAIHINYGHTSHEPLAQGSGSSTFHVTEDGAWWQTLGEAETPGTEVFTIPERRDLDMKAVVEPFIRYSDVFRSGVESDQPLKVRIGPILRPNKKRGEQQALCKGGYTLNLLFVEPTCTAPVQRVMEVQVEGASQAKMMVDPYKMTQGKNRALVLSIPVTLSKPGQIHVTLMPLQGRALICGAILNPVMSAKQGLTYPR